LSGKQDLKLNLHVDKVSLGNLMQQLTGARATATGVISGELPVAIGADGMIGLQQASLQAEEPGIISMAQDAIPGDNAQIAIVRDILKNFHYSVLSIGVDNGKDNKLSVLMKLEGGNPDMYSGHPVQLNVQLNGDVLNFVQQNILALTNPRKFLEQGKDAKP
jgi:hypothetical protein